MTSLYILTCDALNHSKVTCACGAVSRARDYSGADRIETHGQAIGVADAWEREGWKADHSGRTWCPSCAGKRDF